MADVWPAPEHPDPSAAELIAARPHFSMHAADGLLLEGVPLHAIADALGTPTWVYSAGAMRARIRALAAALDQAGLTARIHYAVKANDHLAVLRLFAAEGLGADVVSGGEFLRARAAGIPAAAMVFSGVGKSDDELRLAVSAGSCQINVESAEELDRLSAIAVATGGTARVALRVNPDVAAATHTKIATGRAGDKFGIAHADIPALYARAARLPGLRPVGLAVHVGSQIMQMAPFAAAFARVGNLVADLRAAGETVDTIDCGGGLGIGYRNEPAALPAALAATIARAFGRLDVTVALEPGRWLVAQAGLLLAGVIQEKRAGGHRFVVLDAAMNDLVRPAMYDAWHGIVPVSAADAVAATSPADVVGPVCESSDFFARGRDLPAFGPASRVAILDAGAYGAAMSSTYNARPLAAAALVDGARWATIRARQPVENLWAADLLPDWLPPPA
jgi:diaminopimelate decarboxylase